MLDKINLLMKKLFCRHKKNLKNLSKNQYLMQWYLVDSKAVITSVCSLLVLCKNMHIITLTAVAHCAK